MYRWVYSVSQKKLYIFNAPYRCNCSRQNEMFYTKMFRKDTRPKIYLHAVMKYSFKINSIYCTNNVCETWAVLAIFGRPFVKRFAQCYQTVVCLSVCLSCLFCLSCSVLSVCPVCNVGVLWPHGWMDQDETWHPGRPRPRPHCVTWGPSSPSRKGAQPPNFRPMSIVAKRLDELRCHLVWR